MPLYDRNQLILKISVNHAPVPLKLQYGEYFIITPIVRLEIELSVIRSDN